jgi:hypothetical protein
MVEAYSRLTKGNGKIIIVGRNRTAADNIIAKLPQSSSQTPPLKFVQCDATLMRNVHATSSEILANHPKINFLVMSLEFMTTKGRDETEEGIDRKLAVHYYARWAFTNDLMPALQKASEDGEEANVFSVLGAGKGADIDVKDLGLKKTYSVGNAGLAAPTSVGIPFSAPSGGILTCYRYGQHYTPLSHLSCKISDASAARGLTIAEKTLHNLRRPTQKTAWKRLFFECHLLTLLHLLSYLFSSPRPPPSSQNQSCPLSPRSDPQTPPFLRPTHP